MLHVFTVRGGEKLRLWQASGESYEHVLMKALAYAMFCGQYPRLQVEVKVGLRYKPDLISVEEGGEFELWVECGMVSITKTAWLMKHTTARKVVIFKIDINASQFTAQLRSAISEKYRPGGRLSVLNFVPEIRDLTASKQIAKVSKDWYTETPV